MRWIHHAARDNRANPRWVWRKKNPNEPVPKSVRLKQFSKNVCNTVEPVEQGNRKTTIDAIYK